MRSSSGPRTLAATWDRDDLNADALWQAVEDGVRRIAATGKVSGVFAGPGPDGAMIGAGARLLGTGSDAGSAEGGDAGPCGRGR
jgi:2-keto-3-deoxy-L-rhamnonate aldolase RhmA